VCICALQGKRLELSTPNLVHSMAVIWHALTQRSEGQGHAFMKTVTIAWLQVKCDDKNVIDDGFDDEDESEADDG